MNLTKALILLVSLTVFSLTAKAAVPYCGAAFPVSNSAGQWAQGFAVGLETPLSHRYGLDWNALFSVVRVTPNGAHLLRTEGRELKVESARGWSFSAEAALLASKTLAATQDERWMFRLFAGAGLYYLQDADVFVTGFQPLGPSAVNRQRTLDGQTLVTPGLTLGFGGTVAGGVEPIARIQHIFAGKSGRDYLLIGFNLKPQW